MGSPHSISFFFREKQDQEHAAKMAAKLKEEEDIQLALRMQDEVMAKKLHEQEEKRCVCDVMQVNFSRAHSKLNSKRVSKTFKLFPKNMSEII